METFVGQNMKDLHDYTTLPYREDVDGTIIGNVVSEYLRDCWNGYHDCLERGWQLLPFWLSSVARDKEDTKPFRSYLAPYTLTRYIGYWQGYILFCWRLFSLNDDRLEFTGEQMELLKVLKTLMRTYEHAKKGELYGVLKRLSVALICHSDYSRASSSLLYYLGVRGYNVDYKQWRQPQDYTTILAGVQFCLRIIILEKGLPKDDRDEFDEDSVVNPVEQFCAIRRKWLIDGEGTSGLRCR
jgi:hypothetical protein